MLELHNDNSAIIARKRVFFNQSKFPKCWNSAQSDVFMIDDEVVICLMRWLVRRDALLCSTCVCLYHHQDQLKQRDQSLRKQEQEMDSLSFRNQQLAKRVELLQEELAVSEAKGKKGKVIMRANTSVYCVYTVG